MKCPNCEKEIKQTEGKREKKFCNSTCRSNVWAKEKRKLTQVPESDEKEDKKQTQDFILAFCGKCNQMTNHIGTACQKCKMPPMPEKKKGENPFDYAIRKNAWKKKYNQ